MTWALSDFTSHEDINFQQFARIWDECRQKRVPSREELSFIKLLPVSPKIVMLDISQTSPVIIYSGSDTLPFFYLDPLGVSLMQAFSLDTFQILMAALPTLKNKQGLMISLKRDDAAKYNILVLPVANSKGRVVQAVAIGEVTEGDIKESLLNGIVSNNTALDWAPVALPKPQQVVSGGL